MELLTHNPDNIEEKKFLYRYISLDKLQNFLESKSIWFSRADKFEDKLECVELQSYREWSNLWRGILKAPEKLNYGLKGDILSTAREFKYNFLSDQLYRQKQTFVSCWYMQDYESIAMWELYSKSDGLALKFDANNLISYILDSCSAIDLPYMQKLVCGPVRYMDYIGLDYKDYPKGFFDGYVAFRKNNSFSHESEYRFVLMADSPLENIFGVPIPLQNLANLNFEIIPSPKNSKSDEVKLIELLQAYNMFDKLKESQLLDFYRFFDEEYIT